MLSRLVIGSPFLADFVAIQAGADILSAVI